MEKAIINVRLTNLFDEQMAGMDIISDLRVRSLIGEAFVDRGVKTLEIPRDVADLLGLEELRKDNVVYPDGSVRELSVVKGLKVEINGRPAVVGAVVEEKGWDIVIGRHVLEELDLVSLQACR
ncbi:MAG: hypothetical protein ABIJ56_02030 [Pseudomonadota bacterium]